MSTLRARERLPNGRFGTAHYRAIHRHLFRDVYTWAGRYRTVRTSKAGNVFCYPENISVEMDRLFTGLKHRGFLQAAEFDLLVCEAAEFLSELNAIHPFREGNGRVQLVLLELLVNRTEHRLGLHRIRKETFLPAMEHSFRGDLRPLVTELSLLRE